ncbi:unnamed protein product, partial [Ectocarpus sp. 8 AP-2014]
VEWFLAGVLEQLAAPPRDEDVDGEALFLWGWPAVGAAGSFLAFMALLLLFAQTVPYATFHVASGAVNRSRPLPLRQQRDTSWSPYSFFFRDSSSPPPPPPPPPSSSSSSSSSSSPKVPFSAAPRWSTPDWSSVFRPSPAADAALFVLARPPHVETHSGGGGGGGGGGGERGGLLLLPTASSRAWWSISPSGRLARVSSSSWETAAAGVSAGAGPSAVAAATATASR